jgi:hypothetical protein
MATDLLTIRQLVGKEMNECTTGTVSSEMNATFVDTDLLDAGDTQEHFTGGWLKFSGGDWDGQQRRVYDFSPQTGMFSVARTLPVLGLGAIITYELHTLISPDDLDRCINNALAHCWYQQDEAITLVSNQRQYYPKVDMPGQVRQVLWRYGSTANQYTYERLSWWRAEPNATNSGAVLLSVKLPNWTDSTTTLLVREIFPYDALTSDADETDCPVEWVTWGAIAEAYSWIARTGPADNVSRYAAYQKEAAQRFSSLCARYTPPAAAIVRLPNDGV